MEEPLEQMMYILWCKEYDRHPSLCETINQWNEFKNIDAKIHVGDCTQEPCSCMRCHYQGLEIDAQNAINYLEHCNEPIWKKLFKLRE